MPTAPAAFMACEHGAVTVDWVILAAAVIGLGLLVLVPVAFSTDSASQGVGEYIAGLNAGYGRNGPAGR
jgi:hypothetical protein